MDKTNEKPKKKGFFATLKESMTKTSEGCGPDCGCHAVKDDKEAEQPPAAGGESTAPAKK